MLFKSDIAEISNDAMIFHQPLVKFIRRGEKIFVKKIVGENEDHTRRYEEIEVDRKNLLQFTNKFCEWMTIVEDVTFKPGRIETVRRKVQAEIKETEPEDDPGEDIG